MSDFSLFRQAADNLDDLTDDGVYGEDAQRLKAARDNNSTAENLYDCLMNIYSNPKKTFGTKNTIGIMYTIADIFQRAISEKGQDAVDVIAAFLMGTKENPELENISSYSTYLFYHVARLDALNSISDKDNPTSTEKTKLANSLIQAYSKGVELIGKMFGSLLTLMQMIHNEPHDLYKNNQLTIFDKTEAFLKLSNGDFDKLTTVIDRSVRNADSHSNMYFSLKDSAFILKDKKKTSITIPWYKMVVEIYPKIGWFVQGFIGAAILVVLTFEDKERFKAATQYINDINSDPTVL